MDDSEFRGCSMSWFCHPSKALVAGFAIGFWCLEVITKNNLMTSHDLLLLFVVLLRYPDGAFESRYPLHIEECWEPKISGGDIVMSHLGDLRYPARGYSCFSYIRDFLEVLCLEGAWAQKAGDPLKFVSSSKTEVVVYMMGTDCDVSLQVKVVWVACASIC